MRVDPQVLAEGTVDTNKSQVYRITNYSCTLDAYIRD
eukprot:COSAG05_NODE_10264_length_574_cov_1.195789_1_plen_36_part_10